MQIDLIAVDMDGTTLRADSTVSEATINAFAFAAEKGIYVVPTTGRVRSMLPAYVAQLPCIQYAVVSNGAVVMDIKQDVCLYRNMLTHQTVCWLYDRVSRYDCYLEIYWNGQLLSDIRYYYQLETEFQIKKVDADFMRRVVVWKDNLDFLIHEPQFQAEKFNLLFKSEEAFEKAREELSQNSAIYLSSGTAKALEINNGTASKWDGLTALCQHLGICKDNTMCIGDSSNDLTMIQHAGLSVAMANADKRLFPFADYVTASNDEDGVAQAIYHYIPQKPEKKG